MEMKKESLAMAYVPWQKFCKVMNADCALRHGTIFEELVLPFGGVKAACANPVKQNNPCNCKPHMEPRGCRR